MTAITKTINLGKVNSYIVQKTVDGWVVVYLNADRSTRPVDGSKIYSKRQAAYRRAKALNEGDPITRGLLDIGACWAVSDKKYQGTGFNDVRPTYHIHPDSSYPHEANIIRFDSKKEIAGWIKTIKQIQEENLDNEQAYDLLQIFWASIEK